MWSETQRALQALDVTHLGINFEMRSCLKRNAVEEVNKVFETLQNLVRLVFPQDRSFQSCHNIKECFAHRWTLDTTDTKPLDILLCGVSYGMWRWLHWPPPLSVVPHVENDNLVAHITGETWNGNLVAVLVGESGAGKTHALLTKLPFQVSPVM